MTTNTSHIISFICLLCRPVLFLFLFEFSSIAQCPANIDFESGDFTGWQCNSGLISPGNISLTASAPLPTRHVIYSADEANGNDYWGGFPKVCPNGSNYSIRLGNDSSARKADAVSYTFTILPDQHIFTLIYNYAVVFQDPGHPAEQQPRLNIEVFNVTDNVIDACSSFDFVSSSGLPGFQDSPQPSNAPVKYKDWSAAFINLSGNAGKTFRISFITTDCSEAAHFGYAYIDMYTLAGCSNAVPASVFCRDDDFADLKAPPGFQHYKWLDANGTILGNGQTLQLRPLPRAGDTLFVQLIPFSGYGCEFTIPIYLRDTLNLVANAGADRIFCIDPSLRLGGALQAGVLYSWSPSTGLNKTNVANPIASPGNTIKYTLNVQNYAGGCRSSDTVNVVKQCEPVEIFVPTAFTPNGDGLNDRLKPTLSGYSKMNYFSIFNRYGQLIYHFAGNNPQGWDGTYKGSNLPAQVVVWMAEAVNVDGGVDVRSGTTVLIR